MKIAKLGASLLFSTRAPAIFIAVVVLNLPFARTKLTSSQMSVSLKNKHSQLMEEFDEPPSRSTLALCLFHWRRAWGCQKAADQQSSPDASATPSVTEAAKTAVKKAIEPKPLVIPADTVIGAVLDQ